jgi:hypothetical protein
LQFRYRGSRRESAVAQLFSLGSRRFVPRGTKTTNKQNNKKKNTMKFTSYLLAVFLPPIYFATKKKWLAFVITSGFFCLSLIFYIMVVLAPLGLILWALSAGFAGWDVRKQMVNEHATILAEKMATKMAETMRQQQQTPPRP